jgi:hypothetical protein
VWFHSVERRNSGLCWNRSLLRLLISSVSVTSLRWTQKTSQWTGGRCNCREGNESRDICKAYHLLILSMSGELLHSMVAFTIVQSNQTTDYPIGNAALGIQRLKKPEHGTISGELCQKVFIARLKKCVDPNWFLI